MRGDTDSVPIPFLSHLVIQPAQCAVVALPRRWSCEVPGTINLISSSAKARKGNLGDVLILERSDPIDWAEDICAHFIISISPSFCECLGFCGVEVGLLQGPLSKGQPMACGGRRSVVMIA